MARYGKVGNPLASHPRDLDFLRCTMSCIVAIAKKEQISSHFPTQNYHQVNKMATEPGISYFLAD